MSLIEDLDELMWPVRYKFDKALTPKQWNDWYQWCNDNFGTGGWILESGNILWLKKEEYLTLFILRWA